MNYIREINAFYDWLETNTLTDSAINLWHALMHVANKAGWPEEFAVALSTLQSKTGVKKDAVITARLRLQQAGRIKFKSRSGQQSAIYSIVPFIGVSNSCVVLTDTNPDANHHTNPDTNSHANPTLTPSINKLNSKQNETKPKDNIYTPEFEKWYSEYPRPEAKADSFRNFEKMRKSKGLDFIWQCTKNYINYRKSIPEKERGPEYSSRNFFGQKGYYEDFEKEKLYANTANLQRKNGSVPYPESERENPDYWGKSDEWVGPPIDDATIDF